MTDKYNNVDPEYRRTITRRRLIALALAMIIVPIVVILQSSQLSFISWVIDNENTGTYAAGDPYGEWIFARCDGEQQQIAVLKDGSLSGVQSLSELNSLSEPNFCDLPLVDNQNLGLWNAQLEQLNRITSDSLSSGGEVLESAMEFPLSSLYLKPVSQWLDADPSNGIEFLDAVTLEGRVIDTNIVVSRSTAEENLTTILNYAITAALTAEPEPQRVVRWLNANYIVEHSDIVTTLADVSTWNAGYEQITPALLEQLDQVSRSQRPEIYQQIAGALIDKPEYSQLLARQLRELRSEERLEVTEWFMTQTETDVMLAKSLLMDFDDIYSGNKTELEAFKLLANKLESEDDGPRLLSNILDDLSAEERRIAAIYMINMDQLDDSRFTLAMMNEFEELHSQSKPRVLTALFLSPQFADPVVQRASFMAVNNEFDGSEKQDLLRAMLNHQSLEPALRSQIEAYVN